MSVGRHASPNEISGQPDDQLITICHLPLPNDRSRPTEQLATSGDASPRCGGVASGAAVRSASVTAPGFATASKS